MARNGSVADFNKLQNLASGTRSMSKGKQA